MNEEWRPIPGNHGYDVSNYGSVRSWRLNRLPWPQYGVDRPIPLKPIPTTAGYLRVRVPLRDSPPRLYFVHALVLEAFVGPRPHGLQTRHLDGNRVNNFVENLCWGTAKENHADLDRHGRRIGRKGKTSPNCGERHHMARLSEADVREIRRRLARGEKQANIAEAFNTGQAAISNIKLRNTWSCLPEAVDEILAPAVDRQVTLEAICASGDLLTMPSLRVADKWGCSLSLVDQARKRSGLCNLRSGTVVSAVMADPELFSASRDELAARHKCSKATVSHARNSVRRIP